MAWVRRLGYFGGDAGVCEGERKGGYVCLRVKGVREYIIRSYLRFLFCG